MSRLITIDAEKLLDLPMKKPEFLVDGFLPRGLTVLAGASKSGKSWLVLLLSLCISRGEPFWDMPTHRCGVLYISLEDTLPRLQSRVYRLTDDADPNLRFCTCCQKITDGLEEQLNMELNEHPDTGLIIIDTLQLIRDNAKDAKTGMYAADYETMFALKRIADNNGIGILVVHHVRKLKDKDDPFNEMSGSTAIGGGADTAICLRKKRSSKFAMLHVTSRDLEYQELKIEQVNCAWELRERKDALQIQQEAVPQYLLRIPDFMQDKQVWRGSASELLDALGESEVSPKMVRKHLVDFCVEVLFHAGIEYKTHRTANSRMIILINLRVTPQEKERIERFAKKCRLSVSEYLRQLANGYAPRELPAELIDDLQRMAHESGLYGYDEFQRMVETKVNYLILACLPGRQEGANGDH